MWQKAARISEECLGIGELDSGKVEKIDDNGRIMVALAPCTDTCGRYCLTRV